MTKKEKRKNCARVTDCFTRVRDPLFSTGRCFFLFTPPAPVKRSDCLSQILVLSMLLSRVKYLQVWQTEMEKSNENGIDNKRRNSFVFSKDMRSKDDKRHNKSHWLVLRRHKRRLIFLLIELFCIALLVSLSLSVKVWRCVTKQVISCKKSDWMWGTMKSVVTKTLNWVCKI